MLEIAGIAVVKEVVGILTGALEDPDTYKKIDALREVVSSPKPPRPRIERLSSPYREPTVHDRLGALADPEVKAWIDAYDEWIASQEAQEASFERRHEAEVALRGLPIARNPEWPEAQGGGPLDMRFNPLACDEDFFIPQAA